MTRHKLPNPDYPDHPFMEYWIDDNQHEQDDYAQSFPETMPPGAEMFIERRSKNRIVHGMRRKSGAAKQVDDSLSAANLAALQTRCAMEKIPYAKTDDRLVLIEKLRAKGVK